VPTVKAMLSQGDYRTLKAQWMYNRVVVDWRARIHFYGLPTFRPL